MGNETGWFGNLLAERRPGPDSSLAMGETKYVADVRDVVDVTLRGSGNLDFWIRYLAQFQLVPLNEEGEASLFILSGKLKWNGVRFAEVAFWVALKDPQYPHAAFLVQAFNSCRFFAWCERVFFQTPYAHAACEVINDSSKVSVSITKQSASLLSANTAALGRFRRGNADDNEWNGPVFLPPTDPGESQRYFIAQIVGDSRVAPFRSEDIFTLSTGAGEEGPRTFMESGFQPREWQIRDNATHRKSKTFKRGNPARTVAGKI
jgi:hypothetical protein